MLLPDLNRLTQSVFRFARDNYTPTLLMNSSPEAQGERHAREAEK